MSSSQEIIPLGDGDEFGNRRYLTLGVNMSGMRCLVVGGGEVGSRKIATLIKAGAQVTVVAPSITASLEQRVASKQLRWIQGEYEVSLIEGFALVVAATSDPTLNLRIASDAESRGILSCNVSFAKNSRVIFPALYEDQQITVAVHSHGRNCRSSQSVRNDIADWLRQRKENRNK